MEWRRLIEFVIFRCNAHHWICDTANRHTVEDLIGFVEWRRLIEFTNSMMRIASKCDTANRHTVGIYTTRTQWFMYISRTQWVTYVSRLIEFVVLRHVNECVNECELLVHTVEDSFDSRWFDDPLSSWYVGDSLGSWYVHESLSSCCLDSYELTHVDTVDKAWRWVRDMYTTRWVRDMCMND